MKKPYDYTKIDAYALAELDRLRGAEAEVHPVCVAEIDPKREAHEPIDICMLDGTRIARLHPQFADLADEIAKAVGLVVSRKDGAA